MPSGGEFRVAGVREVQFESLGGTKVTKTVLQLVQVSGCG